MRFQKKSLRLLVWPFALILASSAVQAGILNQCIEGLKTASSKLKQKSLFPDPLERLKREHPELLGQFYRRLKRPMARHPLRTVLIPQLLASPSTRPHYFFFSKAMEALFSPLAKEVLPRGRAIGSEIQNKADHEFLLPTPKNPSSDFQYPRLYSYSRPLKDTQSDNWRSYRKTLRSVVSIDMPDLLGVLNRSKTNRSIEFLLQRPVAQLTIVPVVYQKSVITQRFKQRFDSNNVEIVAGNLKKLKSYLKKSSPSKKKKKTIFFLTSKAHAAFLLSVSDLSLSIGTASTFQALRLPGELVAHKDSMGVWHLEGALNSVALTQGEAPKVLQNFSRLLPEFSSSFWDDRVAALPTLKDQQESDRRQLELELNSLAQSALTNARSH